MTQVGELEIEGLDSTTLRLRWGERLGTRELDAIIGEIEAMVDALGGGTFAVNTMSVLEGDLRIDPEARSLLVAFARRGLVRRSAIVGGPRRARVLIQLLVNAIHLVVPDTTQTKFFETEAEALAWLRSP